MSDFSHANVVRDEYCLELIGRASQCYNEASNCHSKAHKKELNQKARKLEVLASLLHGGLHMAKEEESKIQKAILFLAMYDPSCEDTDKVIEKVNDVAEKLNEQKEEKPGTLNG